VAERPANALPCPYDMSGLLPPGVADSLSAMELGALYRLVGLAWAETTFGHSPGSVPDDPAILARVARVTGQQWDEIAPVVRLVFRPTSGGRLVCPALADLWTRADARRRQCLEAASAAGRASAAARSGRLNRPVNRTVNRSVQTGLEGSKTPLDGVPARARAERSTLKTERNTPIQQPTLSVVSPAPTLAQPDPVEGRDVCASLGRRAQELAELRLAEWRRGQALGMLRAAFDGWRAAGLTTLPEAKVRELAGHPNATPARVQAVVEAAQDALRDAGGARGGHGPAAIVISRLGAARRPRPPMEPPLQLVELWRRREELARAELEPAAARLARTEQLSSTQAEGRKRDLRARLEAMRAAKGLPA
jgi:uncharacterized protein YdaU (DUF1376 family)